jgi:hypothetical protein
MASGVGSPWGYSPQMVAGINQTLDRGSAHLTGQLGMTSTPITFRDGNYISPLTIQNKPYYSHRFGKKTNDLKKVNAEIKYLQSI